MSLEHDLCTSLFELRTRSFCVDLSSHIKLLLLDTFGVMSAARDAPGIAELNTSLSVWGGGAGHSTLLLTGERADPGSAALGNAAAAHALDFDDQYDPARIHAFCVVLPAALAAAEMRGDVTGREFLAAVTLGVEVFCRVGLACHDSLNKGWHPTTMFGVFAAATTAGTLLQLSSDQLISAMGLAFVQMGGTTQSISDGVLAKRLGPGFAARSGVLAAHLARSGLTGPYRFLTGSSGLFHLYERDIVEANILTADLGSEWHARRISLKPYPCCRCNHTVIELALKLRGERLTPDQIESVEITMSRVNGQIVGRPFGPETASNPVVHAQFNAAYNFARALVDGVIGLPSFSTEKVMAEDVAWARCITVGEAPDIAADAVAPARVHVRLRSGEVVAKSQDVMKGSPEYPMTTAEVMAKFNGCMEVNGAAKSDIERFSNLILAAEKIPDVRSLITAFPR